MMRCGTVRVRAQPTDRGAEHSELLQCGAVVHVCEASVRKQAVAIHNNGIVVRV